MLSRLSLQYFADRLRPIDEEDCVKAHALAVNAIRDFASIERSGKVEKELCEEIWDHITHALDHGLYSPVHKQLLDAIEAEMCGRVMSIRLADGTLRGPATAEQIQAPRGLLSRWITRTK